MSGKSALDMEPQAESPSYRQIFLKEYGGWILLGCLGFFFISELITAGIVWHIYVWDVAFVAEANQRASQGISAHPNYLYVVNLLVVSAGLLSTSILYWRWKK